MRKNARKVINAFLERKPAAGDAKMTIHTNGQQIYSYAMLIAERKPDGSVWIASYEQSPSKTTTTQIHACLVGLSHLRQYKKPEPKKLQPRFEQEV